MRTTLNIDDDVLAAAKELAAKEGTNVGKILSRSFRKALHQRSLNSGAKTGAELKNGVPVLRSRGSLVTTDKVERIMEEEGI
ncbi:MAG: CopG family transcriptional regulator [Verrucomicrobia bacterium]|nr:CopG family transcriptional regulator [Verrucomicrobiota bacterium]